MIYSTPNISKMKMMMTKLSSRKVKLIYREKSRNKKSQGFSLSRDLKKRSQM